MAKKRKKKGPYIEAASDGFVWVKTGEGRWMHISTAELNAETTKEVGPSVHDTDYDEQRYKTVYGEKMFANEDLRCKDAERSWYNYFKGTTPDGRYVEGPRPFTSRKERLEYCRRFGFTPTGE